MIRILRKALIYFLIVWTGVWGVWTQAYASFTACVHNPATSCSWENAVTGQCNLTNESYTCYDSGSYTNSCASTDMSGYYQLGPSQVNLQYPGGNSSLAPSSWDTFYGSDASSCSPVPSGTCGGVYNLAQTGDVTGYTYNKACYTTPPGSLTPCNPNPSQCSGIVATTCQATIGTLCSQQKLTYHCGATTTSCAAAASGPTPTGSAGDNGFSKYVTEMSIANALVKNASFVMGQLRIFGGTNDECHFITSGALTQITVITTILSIVLTVFTAGGYAAAAGAIGYYGVSVLSTWKCCTTNPEDINPHNGLCQISDVKLSYARKKNYAVRIDGPSGVGGNPVDSGDGDQNDCLNALGPALGPDGFIPTITPRQMTDCGLDSLVSQDVLISEQSWCYFPNMLSKIVQVQGRAQLQALLLAGAAGSTAGTINVGYYGASATAGNWTTPVNVNGNLVSLWQWASECSSPTTAGPGDLAGICPPQNRAWLAICSAGASCPASPGGNPNFSAPNNVTSGQVGWVFVPIDSTSTTPVTLNRFALAKGQCSGTGTGDICDYTVHGWPAGIGGTLHSTLKLKWPEAFPAPTGFNADFTTTSPMGDNIVLQAYTYNDAAGQPTGMSPIVRYSLDGGSTWSGPITLPTNQPAMNYALPGGPASPAMTVYGGCTDGQCHYTFSYQVNVTAKPWGYYTWKEQQDCGFFIPPVSFLGACVFACGSTWIDKTCDSRTGCVITNSHDGNCYANDIQRFGYVWHPDCTGFTLPQIESMDFSKMNFSAYLATLSPQNPASSLATTTQSVDNAQTRAEALQGGAPANGEMNTNPRTFTLNPANGVWPGTNVTLQARTTYPLTQNNVTQQLPVTQVTVNWGDGNSSAQLVSTQQVLTFKHAYGTMGCPTSSPGSCSPSPSTPTTYNVTVTYYTSAGSFTDTGTVLVSTQAPIVNPQSPGAQSHGTVNPSSMP